MTKKKTYNIAILGATGNVGRTILSILHERQFPVGNIVVLASRRSAGKEISFGDTNLKVQSAEGFDFTGIDIVLASAGKEASEKYVPRAAKAGAVVIDNGSFWRMDPDVPLVVPEVNPEAIADYKKKNIIANPNCSTIQMVVALKPLHDAAKIKRVIVSTYQSVSGAGKEAMDELFNQSRHIFMNQEVKTEVFSKRIAFNLIPQIDAFMDSGDTKEEWKMVAETKKILDPNIKVNATCVRVPVFIGHSESVNIEFEEEISATQARSLLRKAKGVVVVDDTEMETYVSPTEVVGEDAVYVSRIREDITVDSGLNMWIVADNLRKGAALNAVQIAEHLIKII